MDKLKQWVALTVVACVAIVAAGWFLLISPKRGEAAELRTQAADQLTANSKLRTELQVLKAQAADLPKEQAKLAQVATKIPDNAAMPSLIRALMVAAADAGVDLSTLSPGAPSLIAPPAPAKPQAPAGDAEAAQQGPDAPAAAGPAASSAGQLAGIPVSLQVFGDYFQVQRFLAELEDLPRAFRVESLNLGPGASPTEPGTSTNDGRALGAQITGFVYMAANRPPATAVTLPDGAAPADSTVETAE